MAFDAEVAIWLADLIAQSVQKLDDMPGLLIEVVDSPTRWAQLIPEASDETGRVGSFLLNFPYRGHSGDPVETIVNANITLPPDTRTESWENDGFARIRLRSDVPLVGLAHLVADILEHVTGAPANPEVSVQFEYGF